MYRFAATQQDSLYWIEAIWAKLVKTIGLHNVSFEAKLDEIDRSTKFGDRCLLG